VSYFFDKIDKNSDSYKQGGVDARSEMSAQVVDLQNQLQAANAKVLAVQSAAPMRAAGNSSRDAVLADRKRIARIMASSVAKYRQGAALKLACETDLALEQASSILTAMPENRPDRPGMSEFEKHMAKIGAVDIGAGCVSDGLDSTGSEEALAADVIAANQAVNGKSHKPCKE
jgi:hypothetical protein